MDEFYALNGLLITLIKFEFCDKREAQVIIRTYLDMYPEVRACLIKESEMSRKFVSDSIHTSRGFTTISYMSSFF
jgi:hypothetical protein